MRELKRTEPTVRERARNATSCILSTGLYLLEAGSSAIKYYCFYNYLIEILYLIIGSNP